MEKIEDIRTEVKRLIKHRWNSLYQLAEYCETSEPTLRKALRGDASDQMYHKLLNKLK